MFDFFKKYAKPVPKVGDTMYVGSSFYLGHGVDDFVGGLCKVSAVEKGISAGKKTHYVSVEERPNSRYNWEYLAKKQAKLEEQFGDHKGHKDPDYRPEFNK